MKKNIVMAISLIYLFYGMFVIWFISYKDSFLGVERIKYVYFLMAFSVLMIGYFFIEWILKKLKSKILNE